MRVVEWCDNSTNENGPCFVCWNPRSHSLLQVCVLTKTDLVETLQLFYGVAVYVLVDVAEFGWLDVVFVARCAGGSP